MRESNVSIEISDREAIELARSDRDPERRAFRVLYERYAADVFRVLERILLDRARAEDAAQETFLRLFQSLEKVDAARPLKPYLLRIAHNLALDALRAGRKRALQLDASAAPPSDESGVIEKASRNELKAEVLAALRTLAPEPRSALVLRHLEGLKVLEVAEVLGCSERTARSRLRTASALFEREMRRRKVLDERGDA